jgi:uncharacterized membrane protein
LTPVAEHWLAWANLAWAAFVGLPWLAPVLMGAGRVVPARAIYTLYGALCHQLADRSFFLGGPQAMLSRAVLHPYLDPGGDLTWSLRRFVGNPVLGYKVAWSDRMVSMYGGMFVGALLYALLRRRIRPPRLWAVMLLTVPMVVDGAAHTVRDLLGGGAGFRYHNVWLAWLVGHPLPATFLVGNGLGSFNSSMRLGTGLAFALGIAWLLYPALDAGIRRALHSGPTAEREARPGAGGA